MNIAQNLYSAAHQQSFEQPAVKVDTEPDLAEVDPAKSQGEPESQEQDEQKSEPKDMEAKPEESYKAPNVQKLETSSHNSSGVKEAGENEAAKEEEYHVERKHGEVSTMELVDPLPKDHVNNPVRLTHDEFNMLF